MKSSAPARKLSIRFSAVIRAVTMMTGIPLVSPDDLSDRQTS